VECDRPQDELSQGGPWLIAIFFIATKIFAMFFAMNIRLKLRSRACPPQSRLIPMFSKF
jgi:hypothetical protein